MDKYPADPWSEKVIGAAIEVHRELGPGFLESAYEEALAVALGSAEIPFDRQVAVPVMFRGVQVAMHRLDMVVADGLVLELKAISGFEDIHFAVMRSYLRAVGLERGLLLNFAAETLQIRRVGRNHISRHD